MYDVSGRLALIKRGELTCAMAMRSWAGVPIPVGARDSKELENIFNPKPLGEPVNPHVQEGVPDPTPDYEAQRLFIAGADYRKVFAS